MGINADGRLEVFVRASDGGPRHIWQDPKGGWSDRETLAGQLTTDPVVGSNADGRLEVFAFDKTGQAWHTAQPDTSSGFPDWSRLGSGVTVDHITVARNADVAIHVEVLKIDEQGQTATLRLSSSPIS